MGCCPWPPPPARPPGSGHVVAFFPSVRPPVGTLAGPDSSLMDPQGTRGILLAQGSPDNVRSFVKKTLTADGGRSTPLSHCRVWGTHVSLTPHNLGGGNSGTLGRAGF